MYVYNQEKIHSLLEDFYYLTKIKICIYDDLGNELCYYPERYSPFCALVRVDENMLARCNACDLCAFEECKKTGKQYVYTCHAGLTECISPILVNKRIVGYVFIGQIRPDGKDFADIAPRLPRKLLHQLSEYFKELPTIDKKKISSAMRIIDACTGYEYLKAMLGDVTDRIESRLDLYITEHIKGDLSVKALCAAFRITHNEIYSIFKEYLGAPPAEYVKARRLERATEMLRSTELRIGMIGQDCGMPDYNYFSKVFKSAYGMSPKEYRRTVREGGTVPKLIFQTASAKQ